METFVANELIHLIVKITAIILGVVYVFIAIIMQRQLVLVNRALRTTLYPLLMLLTFVNIVVGILFIVAVIIL